MIADTDTEVLQACYDRPPLCLLLLMLLRRLAVRAYVPLASRTPVQRADRRLYLAPDYCYLMPRLGAELPMAWHRSLLVAPPDGRRRFHPPRPHYHRPSRSLLASRLRRPRATSLGKRGSAIILSADPASFPLPPRLTRPSYSESRRSASGPRNITGVISKEDAKQHRSRLKDTDTDAPPCPIVLTFLSFLGGASDVQAPCPDSTAALPKDGAPGGWE
ncbi:hypothetical protein C8R47DRAFT_1205825 [Mycena vitilis]|nr:hypothetical protein C8R47DRAFT_1205825 [Mycena vitilis]